jgi:hypothetical protein
VDEGVPLALAWLVYLAFLAVLAYRILWRPR